MLDEVKRCQIFEVGDPEEKKLQTSYGSIFDSIFPKELENLKTNLMWLKCSKPINFVTSYEKIET